MSTATDQTRIGPRQHVEAVAIIRNLIAALGPPTDETSRECIIAGNVWLRENHPSPEVYIAAVRETLEDVDL